MPKRSAIIARISEFDMFDKVEYWSLDTGQLGKSIMRGSGRQVAVITGGGAGIGARHGACHGQGMARVSRHSGSGPEAAGGGLKKIGGKARG